jgi:hypothetical protein
VFPTADEFGRYPARVADVLTVVTIATSADPSNSTVPDAFPDRVIDRAVVSLLADDAARPEAEIHDGAAVPFD